MTVQDLAGQLGLWERLRGLMSAAARDEDLATRVGRLPVHPSRATTRLGSYQSRAGEAIAIRLQFSQEADLLAETLMHEIAHVCDHLDNQSGEVYRAAHGPGWQAWMKIFGQPASRRGHSEELTRIYRKRLKVVAVCDRCGLKIRRLRRLNRRRRYLHAGCGGALRSL